MSNRESTDESEDRLKRQRNRSAITVVVFAAVMVLGVALRVLSGHEVVSASLIYAPDRQARYPGSRTPEDTATSFYLSIDNGDYERAYGLILEPIWTKEQVSYRDEVSAEGALFLGWTEEEEFLKRLEFEIGPGGSGIKLNGVHAHVVNELEAELYAGAFDISGLRSAFRVKVQGSILGACSIFSWKKELTVLQVGRHYRVLLDGSKDANSFYYQSWFTGFERIGDLRLDTVQSSNDTAAENSTTLKQPVQYGGGGSKGEIDLKIPTGCPCGGGS